MPRTPRSHPLPRPQGDPVIWPEFSAAVERWRAKSVIVDGTWRQKIADMSQDIFAGKWKQNPI